MIAILKKFFDFCAEKNRHMFYHTLFIGALIAVCEACKFPAIYLVVDGFLTDTISDSKILRQINHAAMQSGLQGMCR